MTTARSRSAAPGQEAPVSYGGLAGRDECGWRAVAVREGFEPSLRFPVNTLSKRAPSAARPPVRKVRGTIAAHPVTASAIAAAEAASRRGLARFVFPPFY
jgi:hypothetical protein